MPDTATYLRRPVALHATMAREAIVALGLALLLVAPLVAAQANTSDVGAKPSPFSRDDPTLVATLQETRKAIQGERIRGCIDEITKSPPTQYRVMGTPTHDAFLEKYKGVFTALSPRLKSHLQTFESRGPQGVAALGRGTNLITVLPGSDASRWVVLGAHYDTREATLGGAAIDNTSGICTVLELARAAIAVNLAPQATLVFAWWDGEEWGLYGSTHFTRDHNSTKDALGLARDAPVKILAAMSFDIVGINYPAKNTWVGYGEPTALDEPALLNLRVAPTVAENLSRIYPRLTDGYDRVQPAFVNFSGLVKEVAWSLLGHPPRWADVRDDEYGRSDHVPFIRAGIPGMRIQGSHDCDTSNGCEWPHYHQASDTLETAEQQAGGRDLLVAGFESAAESGGLPAVYVALKGSVGDYGSTARPEPAPDGGDLSRAERAPALGGAALLASVILLALLRRSRRPPRGSAR